MKRVLLAFGSEDVGKEVCSRLSGRYEVMLCRDRAEILDTLWEYRPDVFALDLMLNGVDSVEIIRAACMTNEACRVLGVSTYFSRYIVSSMEALGVCSLIKQPCESGCIAGAIADLADWEDELQDDKRRIRSLLASLGFHINTESCRITELAILTCLHNPEMGLTTEVYPQVAIACGGRVTQVEKAIRSSVESAWKHCDQRLWRLYFATEKNGLVDKPTNKEFLARMTMCIREEQTRAYQRDQLIERIG